MTTANHQPQAHFSPACRFIRVVILRQATPPYRLMNGLIVAAGASSFERAGDGVSPEGFTSVSKLWQTKGNANGKPRTHQTHSESV